MCTARSVEGTTCPKTLQSETTSRVTRRGFLGGIGAGAAEPLGRSPIQPAVDRQNARPELATRPDRFSRLFPGLPPFAIQVRGPERTPRDGRQERIARCQGSSRGRTDSADHQSGSQSEQPRQPDRRRRSDIPRTVPRSRHDVRPTSRLGVPTRPERSLNAQDAGVRSRLGLRAGTDRRHASLRPGGSRQVQGRERRAVRRPARSADGPRSSPIRATTSTSSSAGLQAAFLLFHNRVVDMLRARRRRWALTHGDAEGAEDAATAADAERFADWRRARGCATCSPRRADWSRGTISGSSSTSSCPTSWAPRS